MAESSQRGFDVFINHRGCDVKRGFVSHLYKSLSERGLHTFLDAEVFQGAERVWDTIAGAISSAPVCIVVFSKNYASSEWCLDELHLILSIPGKIVLPVFYEVEPKDLRRSDQSQEFLDRQKLAKRHSEGRVAAWISDLEDASLLSGFEFKAQEHKSEAGFVHDIVSRIVQLLNPSALHVANYPVGLTSRAYDVIQILDRGNAERMSKTDEEKQIGAFVIGILGMVGSGKSTIAREVFNQIQNRFGATCFLENTRKRAMTSDGTVSMQRQMLKDLCMDTTTEVGSLFHGKTLLEKRLCSKVVLIVLDDVDEPISVRDLVPISVLGSRSYVIITSHNEHSLRLCDSKMIYRVPHLSSTDAVRLFQLHAFGDYDPSYMTKMKSAEEVARACGGLPLALEVIGTELFRKWNDCVWKDVLKSLHKHMYLIENKNLMQPLRISFDMLDEPEKTMFLDIAHYFHGQGSAIAACFWEGLGLSAAKGLQNLLDRCLVKLVHNEEETILTMHDILQDLGRSLVVQENSQLGKRSRLLTPDSETVMTNGWATGKVKRLSLVGSRKTLPQHQLSLMWQQLSLMWQLELLMLDSVVWEPHIRFPPSVTYFMWHRMSVRSLPDEFLHFPQLVVLDLSYGSFEYLWDDEVHIELPNLRVFNLSYCHQLSRLPNTVGELMNLESFILHDCITLTLLPTSMDKLQYLQLLDLQGCMSFELSNLQCPYRLITIPKMIALQKLVLSGCYSLDRLPENISQLTSLTVLDLRRCLRLSSLPRSIGRLHKLEKLLLSKCDSLDRLPENITQLTSLTVLDLRRCSRLSSLPRSIGQLHKLEKLLLSKCDSLDLLPKNISQLTSLTVLDLRRCSRLSSLPRSIGQLHKLEKLLLSGCVALTSLPTAIGGLTQLTLLHLEDCTALASIPLSIGKLSKLEELSLRGCIAIRSFSDFVSDFRDLVERMYWNSAIHLPCFEQFKILKMMLVKRFFQMEVIRNFYETLEACSRDLLFSFTTESGDITRGFDLHRLYNRDVFAYRCLVHQELNDSPKMILVNSLLPRFQSLDFIGPRKVPPGKLELIS